MIGRYQPPGYYAIRAIMPERLVKAPPDLGAAVPRQTGLHPLQRFVHCWPAPQRHGFTIKASVPGKVYFDRGHASFLPPYPKVGGKS